MTPLSDQQRLFLIESDQVYRAWEAAARQKGQYRYGMKWLKSGGKEYLIRLADARGNGRSMGPRSPQTETAYAAFTDGKARAAERLSGLSQRLREQSRLNRAIGLGRLPTIIGEILCGLNVAGVGGDFRVVGTQSIYGYESLAAVHCRLESPAPRDAELLYDARKRLALVSTRLDENGLLGILRKIDKSFTPVEDGGFRAINKGGFVIDLVGRASDMRNQNGATIAPADFVAAVVPSLEWLANSPRVQSVAISANGMPVLMSLCDPRAFAMHKAWLSKQAGRDPAKQLRDIKQAALVAQLVVQYLPNFPFDAIAMQYPTAEVNFDANA